MSIWNSITISSIDAVINVPSEKGRYTVIDHRPWYGISFCRDDGQITYHMNGSSVVSNRTSAVLLPMGGCYTLTGDAEGEFPLINFYCPAPLDVHEIMAFPLHAPEAFIRDFDRMHTLWVQDAAQHRAELLSLLYGIFSRLGEESKEEADSPLLRPALDLLSREIFSPTLSVAHLAQSANLSETYFRRLFRRHYGTSPKQYILSLRLGAAKQLLCEQTTAISAVAEQCGFASVYHFSRAFKASTGLSPSEYALQRTKNASNAQKNMQNICTDIDFFKKA